LCFQGFNEEVEGLPGEYAPPDGRLLLVEYGLKPAGCIALRKLEQSICEMKRLYVKPGLRNIGLGRILVEVLILEAKLAGYDKMRLDTIPSMQAAIKLYKKLGFIEIEPYRFNPIPGALYMELNL
jgi:ribosomal protein S18 acetylase RimI-like enzyme